MKVCVFCNVRVFVKYKQSMKFDLSVKLECILIFEAFVKFGNFWAICKI